MDSFKYYVGTYTSGESKGIYSFSINNNKFHNLKLEGEVENPTYLYRNDKNIYSISSQIKDSVLFGGVSSFAINENELDYINSKHIKGKAPCHLAVNRDNTFLICGNYHENRILCYKVNNGKLGDCISEVNHNGKGINPTRQEKPHIHYVCFSNDESKVFSLDLGTDMMMTYSFNKGILKLSKEECVKFPSGTGPRHMIYNDSTFYILSELTGEVFILNHNSTGFKIINSVSLVSKEFKGEILGAAIRLHPNKRFLYASERGENKIHLINLSMNDATLKESFSSFGDGPRDFNISKDGEYLICCNQNSNNIVLYKILNSGALEFLDELNIPSPVYVG